MAQYLKPNSELGYIEDGVQIECLKFNNLRHSILGCMLGDFDETGAYVVDPEIVKELIEMPKYILETYDNIELCKSTLKLDKHISFLVTFEGNKATLSLLEKMSYEANFALNSGTYSNINEYVLDSVETSGEINRNAIYTRWNIGAFGGQLLDVFNCDDSVLAKYFGIVNRFKYLLNANKVLLEKENQLEEIEAEYANAIFDALKFCPNLKKAVVETVKQSLNEKKDALRIDKPNFAKTFNEVLDNAIEKNIKSVAAEEQELFQSKQREATITLNVQRSDAVEIETVSQENKPNLFRLITNQVVFSQAIGELASSMLQTHKQVVEELSQNGNVEKLVGNLYSSGIWVMEVKQEVKTSIQTDKAPSIAKSTTATKPVKKDDGNQQKKSSQKSSTQGSQKKATTVKNPQATNPKSDSTTTQTDKTKTLVSKSRRRRASSTRSSHSMGGGSSSSLNEANTENSITADMLTFNEFKAEEESIHKQEIAPINSVDATNDVEATIDQEDVLNN